MFVLNKLSESESESKKMKCMLIGKQLQLRIQTTKELNLGLKATKNLF